MVFQNQRLVPVGVVRVKINASGFLELEEISKKQVKSSQFNITIVSHKKIMKTISARTKKTY
jgi:hypothetical protein